MLTTVIIGVTEETASYRCIVKEATMVVEVAATQQRLFVYSINIHLVSTRYLGLFINKREKKKKKV